MSEGSTGPGRGEPHPGEQQPPGGGEARAPRRRRPPLPYVESIAEKRIREAMERGEFDNLRGAGKPLASLDRPYREDWWISGLVEREQLDMIGATSPTMILRREAAEMRATVADLPREESVRAVVDDYNRRVRLDRLRPASGPQMPPLAKVLDVEEVLATWREDRARVEEEQRRRAEEAAARERERLEAALAARRALPWWRRGRRLREPRSRG